LDSSADLRAEIRSNSNMGKKKSSKSRQRRRQQKAARRKARKKSSRRPTSRRSPALLRQAGDWRLLECLVTKSWKNPGEIVQLLVARMSPAGKVAVGLFLVDLGCLGIKNAHAQLFNSRAEYRATLRQSVLDSQPMKKVRLNLAAKIVHEAVAYAQQLGFEPHPDFRKALPILGDADPATCKDPVPLGYEGKPYFVAGPYDNIPNIIAKLEKAVGTEGFHYVVPIMGDMDLFVED
jgi:hypothetical protein